MNAHMPISSRCAPYQRGFHKFSSSPKILSLSPFPSGCIPTHTVTLTNDTDMPGAAAPPNNCICDRPASHVVCMRCGFEFVGRLQKICPSHPKKMALMDHRECPNRLCKSIHLIEIAL